jgi:hypothetical protein
VLSLERVAATTWSFERATRAEAAQLCHKIRHDAIEREQQLKKRPLPTLTPPDADAAREVLRALVDRQTSRLKLILARNQEIAEADAAEAANRLAFDPSPEADPG